MGTQNIILNKKFNQPVKNSISNFNI